MAYTFDNINHSDTAGNSHDCVMTIAANATIAVLAIQNGGAGYTVSNVTLNSVAMTSAGSITVPSSTQKVYIYYQINPPSGSQTFHSDTAGTGGTTYLMSATWLGSSTNLSSNTSSQTSSGTTLSVVTTTTNAVAMVVAVCSANGDGTANTNTTVRQTYGGLFIGDTAGPGTPGSSTQIFNCTTPAIGAALVFEAAAATSSSLRNLGLLGVGN